MGEAPKVDRALETKRDSPLRDATAARNAVARSLEYSQHLKEGKGFSGDAAPSESLIHFIHIKNVLIAQQNRQPEPSPPLVWGASNSQPPDQRPSSKWQNTAEEDNDVLDESDGWNPAHGRKPLWFGRTPREIQPAPGLASTQQDPAEQDENMPDEADETGANTNAQTIDDGGDPGSSSQLQLLQAPSSEQAVHSPSTFSGIFEAMISMPGSPALAPREPGEDDAQYYGRIFEYAEDNFDFDELMSRLQ